MSSSNEKKGLGFWSGLLREAFSTHDELEIEERWANGTIGNIPSISQVSVECPRPWMFARMFFLTLVAYFLLNYLWLHFHNPNMLPGLIFVGTCVFPLCVLVFFFELNARRNVSIFLVGRILFLGGSLSLLFSLFMFKVTSALGLNWMGASVAGIAEEIGKLLAVVAVARNRRYPYILNGILFGAAVGTGFAIYESAGYALNALVVNILNIVLTNTEKVVATLNSPQLATLNLYEKISQIYAMLAEMSRDDFIGVINIRGFLAPMCHIIWTAITAGGFWLVKGSRKFSVSMLFDIRFIGCLLSSMLLHAIWNCSWNPNVFCAFDKQIALGIIGWIIVLTIARLGFKQLAAEKASSQAEPEAEEGIKEVICIQTVYVEKLVKPSPEPAQSHVAEKMGYDYLGIENEVSESKVAEANRERPDFHGRSWYDDYKRAGADKNDEGIGSGTASRRRWENYMKRGEGQDGREK